jgi:hypothetical protein
MKDIFDAYEIRARLIPSIIVLSPLVLPIAAVLLQTDGTFFSSSLIATCLVSLIYGFSLVVRGLGKKVEKDIWKSSGDWPSSKALLNDDSMFSASTKAKIKKALKHQFDIDLDSFQDADKFLSEIAEGFRLALQRIRQCNQEGIWHKHEAEYGCLRNLLGSSKIWMVNAVISTGLCSVAFLASGKIHLGLFTALSVCFCILIWHTRRKILPQSTISAANRFAESSWLCFLNTITDGREKQGKVKENAA